MRANNNFGFGLGLARGGPRNFQAPPDYMPMFHSLAFAHPSLLRPVGSLIRNSCESAFRIALRVHCSLVYMIRRGAEKERVWK